MGGGNAMIEWKIIATRSAADFQRELNQAMRDGFAVVCVSINSNRADVEPFTAVMNRMQQAQPVGEYKN